jgi:hypothetical protein
MKSRWVEFEYNKETYDVERAWFQYGDYTVSGYQYSESANMIRFICHLFEEGAYSMEGIKQLCESRALTGNYEEKLPRTIIQDAEAEIGVSRKRLFEMYEDICILTDEIKKKAGVSKHGLN